MKKRIVALILTVVMSLLALTSCAQGFDFAEEDLSAYADFNYADFKAALQKLEIEDGEFTTDSDIREKLVTSTIYNAIADKIIADTDEEDYIKEGTLNKGDVLYFVYYACDAEGNKFFGEQMNVSSLTSTSTKANHTLKLDDYLEGESDEFLKLVRDNLAESADLKDYVYKMLTASELQTDAEEALKAEKPEATKDEITAAKAEAIKVKAGDKIYISYTRTYKKTEDDKELTVTEKASYELMTVAEGHHLYASFTGEHSVANVGGTLEVLDTVDGETVKTKKSFDVTIGEITYTYSDVKILWKVEGEGEPIATFKYTPYADDSEEPAKNEYAPTSLYSSATKVNLTNKELTYYVYPVYAIDTPAYDEITAEQLLYYVYGSKLTESSFEIFEDESFVNGSEKIADLLEDIANIFDTKSEDNEYYKKGTDLKLLLDAYNNAVEKGGSSPTTAQKEEITKAQEALTDAQNKLLKEVIAKLVAAKSGEKVLGDEVLDEYKHNTEHSLKESYDSDIVKKVQTAVWELIDESVKVKGYPTELLEEYIEHLYEEYEYNYYKGDFDSKTSNYEKYASFTAYLEGTLKVKGQDKIDEAIEKEAKAYLDPIIKVFVVAKACKDDAVTAMSGANGYIELDIAGGAYKVDEEAYRDTYGDAADKKIEEAKKNAEESIKSAREEAGMFIVDDAYMNRYKKEIGNAYYNQLIEENGDINLRTAFQFNRLFYYLTSTDLEFNEEEGHSEYKYTEDGKFLSFRTVKYTIKADDADTDAE